VIKNNFKNLLAITTFNIIKLTECQAIWKLIVTSYPAEDDSLSNAVAYCSVDVLNFVALVALAYSADYDCVAG
jgi:hypothetical protein